MVDLTAQPNGPALVTLETPKAAPAPAATAVVPTPQSVTVAQAPLLPPVVPGPSPQVPPVLNAASPSLNPVSPSTPQRQGQPPQIFPMWFFKHSSGGWTPFGRLDTNALEEAFKASPSEPGSCRTDGGRFVVDIAARTRTPLFWEQEASKVVRALWFVGHDATMVPMDEASAAMVEAEFAAAWNDGQWKRRVTLPNQDVVELRSPQLFCIYEKGASGDFGKPRILQRGYGAHVDFGDPPDQKFDHCVLVLPGLVGDDPLLSSLGYGQAAGDRRGTFVDCVDTLRVTTRELLQKRFSVTDGSKSSGRIEFLPVVWDGSLESKKETLRALEPLNLRTIKSLRRFISKECLEVLTYSCEGQAAVADVADQINKITSSFLEHNPTFTGEFHLIGHGLGGCILLNILTTPAGDSTGDEADETVNSTVQVVDDGSADEDEEVAEETAPAQVPALPTLEEFFESQGFGEYLEKLKEEEITMETLLECGDSDYKELGFNMGQRKRIMKELKEMKERRDNAEKFAAERAAEIETKRTLRLLEKRRRAAERAEARTAKMLSSLRKAETRPREVLPRPSCATLTHPPSCCFLLGAPVGFFSALEPHGNGMVGPETQLTTKCQVYNIFHPYDPLGYRIEPLLNGAAAAIDPVLIQHYEGGKKLHLEFKEYVKSTSKDLQREVSTWAGAAWNVLSAKIAGDDAAGAPAVEEKPAVTAIDTLPDAPKKIELEYGKLNGGERVDYQLQEEAVEILRENLMNMRAHSSYWSSPDTAMFILERCYRISL